jgi:hypothetical protein
MGRNISSGVLERKSNRNKWKEKFLQGVLERKSNRNKWEEKFLQES